MENVQKAAGPEGPYRLQQGGKTAEIQHGTANGPQQDKSPHLALPAVQHKEKQHHACAQTIHAVQHARAAGKPEAKGPQEVIEAPCEDAQQNRLGKKLQLQGNDDLHAYPNRRLRKPPRPCAESS